MPMMCAVSFERYGRLYYFDAGDLRVAVGDKVLVPTDEGPEVAECVWAPEWVDEPVTLSRLVGLATAADLARDERHRALRAEARKVVKRLVREHDLPMKLVGLDYVPDAPARDGNDRGGPRYTVYFGAPERVDFRLLVRDLARALLGPGRAAAGRARGTRRGCRAASGRVAVTCAARPSSRTSSRSRSAWPRTRTCRSTR